MARTGGAERRKLLIAEATAAFGARGYDSTTLDQVAEAAGVRKQSLLYHFRSKEELFDACVADLSHRVGASLQQALEDDRQGWQRVEHIIRSMFMLLEHDPHLALFAREAARRKPEVVQKVAGELEPLRKRALQYLEWGMDEGQFRRQDPGLLLFMLYTAVVSSVTEAGVLRAVAGGSKGRAALRARREELIEFVRSALVP